MSTNEINFKLLNNTKNYTNINENFLQLPNDTISNLENIIIDTKIKDTPLVNTFAHLFSANPKLSLSKNDSPRSIDSIMEKFAEANMSPEILTPILPIPTKLKHIIVEAKKNESKSPKPSKFIKSKSPKLSKISSISSNKSSIPLTKMQSLFIKMKEEFSPKIYVSFGLIFNKTLGLHKTAKLYDINTLSKNKNIQIDTLFNNLFVESQNIIDKFIIKIINQYSDLLQNNPKSNELISIYANKISTKLGIILYIISKQLRVVIKFLPKNINIDNVNILYKNMIEQLITHLQDNLNKPQTVNNIKAKLAITTFDIINENIVKNKLLNIKPSIGHDKFKILCGHVNNILKKSGHNYSKALIETPAVAIIIAKTLGRPIKIPNIITKQARNISSSVKQDMKKELIKNGIESKLASVKASEKANKIKKEIIKTMKTEIAQIPTIFALNDTIKTALINAGVPKNIASIKAAKKTKEIKNNIKTISKSKKTLPNKITEISYQNINDMKNTIKQSLVQNGVPIKTALSVADKKAKEINKNIITVINTELTTPSIKPKANKIKDIIKTAFISVGLTKPIALLKANEKEKDIRSIIATIKNELIKPNIDNEVIKKELSNTANIKANEIKPIIVTKLIKNGFSPKTASIEANKKVDIIKKNIIKSINKDINKIFSPKLPTREISKIAKTKANEIKKTIKANLIKTGVSPKTAEIKSNIKSQEIKNDITSNLIKNEQEKIISAAINKPSLLQSSKPSLLQSSKPSLSPTLPSEIDIKKSINMINKINTNKLTNQLSNIPKFVETSNLNHDQKKIILNIIISAIKTIVAQIGTIPEPLHPNYKQFVNKLKELISNDHKIMCLVSQIAKNNKFMELIKNERFNNNPKDEILEVIQTQLFEIFKNEGLIEQYKIIKKKCCISKYIMMIILLIILSYIGYKFYKNKMKN